MTILYSAVGIGVVLMVLALVLNIYSKFKQREIGEAIFSENGLCGLLFLRGAILLAANAILSLSLPPFPSYNRNHRSHRLHMAQRAAYQALRRRGGLEARKLGRIYDPRLLRAV